MKKNNQLDKEKQEAIRRLVIERIKASSDDLSIMIGGKGNYSKAELIKSVEEGTEVGKQIMDIQMDFLKAMAEGKIYKE
jgi:hypothetical protein